MQNYPYIAKTIKTIDKFNFGLYSAIDINMLKYNHDSSATIRLLSCLIDTYNEVTEDLPYEFRLNFKGYEFITIDRLHGFLYDNIQDFTWSKPITGFSSYTGKYYILEGVDKKSDFTRHSLPCDAFFTETVESVEPIGHVTYPYVKTPVSLNVNNSSITITPVSGFNMLNKDTDDNIIITVYGIDRYDNEVSEDIEIECFVDYVTNNEFKKVTGIMSMNNKYSCEIKISPFIAGDIVFWDKDIVDRQTLDSYKCVLSLDYSKGQLVFSALRDNPSEYPLSYDPIKTVDLELYNEDSIKDHFIDVANRLVYLIKTNGIDEYICCYPLIVPKLFNNTLDDLKTEEQSVRIEYIDDVDNEQYSFFVFPTSKTNDVDFMHININGELYKDNIVLDLIRERLEDNKFDIPYSELFKSEEYALIEFISYGETNAVSPVFVDRPRLRTLWVKDLDDPSIGVFNNEADIEVLGPVLKSTKIPYAYTDGVGYGEREYGGVEDIGYGGTLDIDASNLYKLSDSGHITVSGTKIINVFKTFYHDEDEKVIVTSDTITHIVGVHLLDIEYLLGVGEPSTVLGSDNNNVISGE